MYLSLHVISNFSSLECLYEQIEASGCISYYHINLRTAVRGVENPVEFTDVTHSMKTIGKTPTIISNGGYNIMYIPLDQKISI